MEIRSHNFATGKYVFTLLITNIFTYPVTECDSKLEISWIDQNSQHHTD